MAFLLTGDHLALETPSPQPHGEEDLGEAFDFEDSEEEEEEEEDDSAAEPSSEAVLRAPPRRRRAASSGVGEEGGQGIPTVPAVSPLGAQGGVAARVPMPLLSAFPLCRWAGAGDPGRVCGILGGFGGVLSASKGENAALGVVCPPTWHVAAWCSASVSPTSPHGSQKGLQAGERWGFGVHPAALGIGGGRALGTVEGVCGLLDDGGFLQPLAEGIPWDGCLKGRDVHPSCRFGGERYTFGGERYKFGCKESLSPPSGAHVGCSERGRAPTTDGDPLPVLPDSDASSLPATSCSLRLKKPFLGIFAWWP